MDGWHDFDGWHPLEFHSKDKKTTNTGAFWCCESSGNQGMINRIVLLFMAMVVSLSVFPITFSSREPVGCQISVVFDGKNTDLVKIMDQDFEQFFNETKVISSATGLTVTKLAISNGDVIVWYKQNAGSPKSFVDLEFKVNDATGTLNRWIHSEYENRSEYAGDDIKARYIKTRTNGSTVSHTGGPALFEFGKDRPSVFVCRPGGFKTQPVGLLKHVNKKKLTTMVFGKESIRIKIYLEPSKDEFEEGFVMVSNSRLLDLDEKRNHTFLVSHDLWRVKPLLSDGWWFSAQTGFFEGADGNCYYPNPGFYPSRSMLSWYCQLENRLFYNIVVVTMKMALDSIRLEGFARLPIMPVYFSQMYGGFVDYLDTRFSTDGVRFLVKCAKLLDCKKAKEMIPKLAKFYSDNFDSVSVCIDYSDTRFISDYIFDSSTNPDVHASINHTLCIINYLLEYEDATGDKTYSEQVDKLLKALTITAQRWIKPNKDLWYGYFPTIATFSNDDYSFLTYNDLRETTRLLEKVRKTGCIGIAKLLEAKTEYMVNAGLLKDEQNQAARAPKDADAMISEDSSISH
jgi:hypothetical protein